jgi:hypothetical protein
MGISREITGLGEYDAPQPDADSKGCCKTLGKQQGLFAVVRRDPTASQIQKQ